MNKISDIWFYELINFFIICQKIDFLNNNKKWKIMIFNNFKKSSFLKIKNHIAPKRYFAAYRSSNAFL